MNNKNHVPDWKLERYLLGELPADELAGIAALESGDDELRGRIAALGDGNAAILAKYPPAWMARKASLASAGESGGAGVSGSTVRHRGIPRWAGPVFACAALLVIIPLYMFSADTAGGAEAVVYENRVKGDLVTNPSLEVWRKAGDDAEKLTPGTAVREGDIVQLRYIVPKSCYGALVSMDGRGVLTVHLSGSDGGAVPLTPGRPIALKTSYQLDDAPKYEAFYLITASDKFDLEAVKLKLMGASHPLGSGQETALPEKQVTAFTLKKLGGDSIN